MSDIEVKHPRRLRWAVRVVLALGVAASIAGDVLHARPNLISQLLTAAGTGRRDVSRQRQSRGRGPPHGGRRRPRHRKAMPRTPQYADGDDADAEEDAAPSETAAAVAFWYPRDPSMHSAAIDAKIGRSERAGRRYWPPSLRRAINGHEACGVSKPWHPV